MLWFCLADEFVVMFREKTGYPIVEPAHMVICVSFILIQFSVKEEKGEKCRSRFA